LRQPPPQPSLEKRRGEFWIIDVVKYKATANGLNRGHGPSMSIAGFFDSGY